MARESAESGGGPPAKACEKAQGKRAGQNIRLQKEYRVVMSRSKRGDLGADKCNLDCRGPKPKKSKKKSLILGSKGGASNKKGSGKGRTRGVFCQKKVGGASAEGVGRKTLPSGKEKKRKRRGRNQKG